ncbi:type I restriction endonuclease subunit S [Clostridium sp. Cult1]|nr:restriction endonuclease subunit S [Clostridium sp. Cult1]MCF6462979.1 type I restriction endonuclease subunit S [Clostridium sp. Cult1]
MILEVLVSFCPKLRGQSGGKYITSVNQRITPEGAKKSVYLKSGALVMSNSMSFGKAYILGIDGCIRDGWLSFEFNKDYLEAELLQFFLSASYIVFDRVAVGTGVRNLNIDRVRTTLIPLPPLAEQKRIVEKVDMIMGILDKLEKELIINI